MRASQVFDLIIIGAGINGAGIARDAAMRGLSVLLLDKDDIGSGTSSGSTRLIHGGLRYLEHGEFGLVRESLRERETLQRIAPHLVRPLPILIPVYKGTKRGRATIRAGMLAYDLLSVGKNLPHHRMLSRAETLAETPGLNPEGLLGAAVYYDTQVEFAERLVLENVLAAIDQGANVLTHSRVVDFLIEHGQITAVKYVVASTGESRRALGKIFVNAAGPWVDQLLEHTGAGGMRLIGGTKGSHIVLAPFSGAPGMALYVEAKSDGRPFFIIPWNSNYLIGTTDVRFEDDLDQVHAEGWEVDYLLAETNRLFPKSLLTRNHILYTYSGVRPLPFSNDDDERSITRRHFVREHANFRNLISIVGGKLTTYRSLAEECVDLLFCKLGKQGSPCRTAQVALPGAIDFSSSAGQFLSMSRFSGPVNNRLLRIYGIRATEIAELCSHDEKLAGTFNQRGDALTAEVLFSFRVELAKTLTDCLLRRTMIGLNSDLAIGDDLVAAEVGRRFLSWNEARARYEVKMYRDHVERMRVLG